MLRQSTLKRVFAAFAVLSLIGFTSSAAWSQPKDIRWGTGPVGSSGHKALVVLANLLNKEMPEYRISVLPMPGAVMTVKGYATGENRRLLRLRRRACRNSRPIPVASRASSRTSSASRCSRSGPTRSMSASRSRPATPTRSRSGPISPARGSTPDRCRSIPASSSRTPWRRSASSTSTRRSTCRPPARSSNSGAIDAMIIYTAGGTTAGAVDLAGFACGRLGGAQSEPGRDRRRSRRRAFQIIEVKPSAFKRKDAQSAR